MRNRSNKKWLVLACVPIILSGLVLFSPEGITAAPEPEFTTDFDVEACTFATTGANPYFILKIGYQLVLEGQEDGDTVHVEITVLRDTKSILLANGRTVKTRVVKERELINGQLVEESRNFFAICVKTNDVFYFGEEVDIYEGGVIVSHEGSWLAGQNGAEPGIMMPGRFLLGSRYFQELAPEVALDRAEHTAMGLTVETPAGVLEDCVEITETSPLEPRAVSIKRYAPGIGLIEDGAVKLVRFGFVR